mmetsp:Transcript_33516/g.88000  ORF Transcript_33516/g.88000 Transcript_33516/m.88000 type:complete len:456 (+) Transcript_33516:208-1575(+)
MHPHPHTTVTQQGEPRQTSHWKPVVCFNKKGEPTFANFRRLKQARPALFETLVTNMPVDPAFGPPPADPKMAKVQQDSLPSATASGAADDSPKSAQAEMWVDVWNKPKKGRRFHEGAVIEYAGGITLTCRPTNDTPPDGEGQDTPLPVVLDDLTISLFPGVYTTEKSGKHLLLLDPHVKSLSAGQYCKYTLNGKSTPVLLLGFFYTKDSTMVQAAAQSLAERPDITDKTAEEWAEAEQTATRLFALVADPSFTTPSITVWNGAVAVAGLTRHTSVAPTEVDAGFVKQFYTSRSDGAADSLADNVSEIAEGEVAEEEFEVGRRQLRPRPLRKAAQQPGSKRGAGANGKGPAAVTVKKRKTKHNFTQTDTSWVTVAENNVVARQLGSLAFTRGKVGRDGGESHQKTQQAHDRSASSQGGGRQRGRRMESSRGRKGERMESEGRWHHEERRRAGSCES